MTQSIDEAVRPEGDATEEENTRRNKPTGVPSNPVYARVGDIGLRAARDGVARGLKPEDIIREMVTKHDIMINLGELRLLLASRRESGSPPKSE